jgi:hypothetical protein
MTQIVTHLAVHCIKLALQACIPAFTHFAVSVADIFKFKFYIYRCRGDSDAVTAHTALVSVSQIWHPFLAS